jgi:hypothetical protein
MFQRILNPGENLSGTCLPGLALPVYLMRIGGAPCLPFQNMMLAARLARRG